MLNSSENTKPKDKLLLLKLNTHVCNPTHTKNTGVSAALVSITTQNDGWMHHRHKGTDVGLLACYGV